MVRVGSLIAAILIAGFIFFIISQAGAAVPSPAPGVKAAEISKIEVR